jgi:hypothetical protein
MLKASLRDLIVVLPGITGSALQKDSKDVWAFTSQAFREFITTLGNDLQALRLGSDYPSDVDELEDGIRAPALMPDIHLIPGLVKIECYSQLIKILGSHGSFVETKMDGHSLPRTCCWDLLCDRLSCLRGTASSLAHLRSL